MIKKIILLSAFSLFVSNCVFASDCEIIHKSVKFYQKSDPSNVCNLYNLANEYYLKKKYQKALNTYEYIITINPQEERAYLKRASIYSEFDDDLDAKREYFRLVKNVPDSIKGNYKMFWFHKYVTEDYEKALKHINKAIELTKGENAEYFYYRGGVLQKMKRYEEAIADYTKYTKSNDKYNYSAYIELQECYKALGDDAKAKEAYLKWDYEYEKNKNKNKISLAENIKWQYSRLKKKFRPEKFLY